MNHWPAGLFVLLVLLAGGCRSVKTGPQPDPTTLDVRQLQAALAQGAVTSEQVVRSLLDKLEGHQHLNAFITVDAKGALAAARRSDRRRAAGEPLGPLHGIPLVAKDNIHVAGLPNSAGTPALSDYVPQSDSPAAARLRDAGVIFLGKTNMHELAFGITSNNAAFGAVANPRDVRTFAGGSSGGSASAIAAGLAPAGLGTDTGGSVRIPAALTGIAALRPTIGRYPSQGVTPISSTRDTIGPMARRVGDLALIDAVLSGDDTPLPEVALDRLRLGTPGYFYADLDPETRRVTESALARLRDAGVTLVDEPLPGVARLTAASGFPIAVFEAVRDLRAYLEEFEIGLTLEALAAAVASPDVKAIMSGAIGERAVPEPAYRAALAGRTRLQRAYRDYFDRHRLDAILFPTTVLPARPIESSDETVTLNGEPVPTFPTYIRNTDPASIAGIPALSLPAGTTKAGLPVGLELDGPAHSDRRLLAIGAVIERELSSQAQ